MNTDITQTTEKKSALVAMAARLNVEPDKLIKTLKSTVFKGATDDELLALCVVSNEYQLNPILKEIHAFPSNGGINPIVGIDGWLKIINRQPNFDGMEVQISDDKESATCTIYCKDRSKPVQITEYFQECKRNTDPWKQMPMRMLRHKAIKECGRVAFGISGIQDEDEARDAMRNVTPQPAVTKREKQIDPSAPITADTVEEPAEYKGHAGGVYTEGAQSPKPKPETTPATGRQKKDRHHFDGKFIECSSDVTDEGKTFWVAVFDDAGNARDMMTFSSTLGAQLEAMNSDDPCRVTYTVGARGSYQLESVEADKELL